MRATTSSGRERLKAIEAESEARKKVVIQPRRARSPCSSTGKPRRQTSLDDLLEVQHAGSKMRSNGESGRRRASLRRRSVQQVLDKDRSDSTQEDRDAETQISVLSLLSNKPKHALRGDRANFDTPLNRLQAMLRREAQIKAKGGSQFSLLVRSGLLARPTLASRAPAWWRMPNEAADAATGFDDRHRRHAERTEGAFKGLTAHCDDELRQSVFRHSLREMRQNRYFLNEKVEVTVALEKRQKAAVIKKAWSVYDSIWGPRLKFADSKDVHDRPSHLEECLRTDFKYAMADHGTQSLIEKRDRRPGAVEEVFDALLDQLDAVYSMFDYYGCVGTGQPVGITLNAFKLFVEDVGLVEKNSKTANASSFDQLFVAVNAGSENRYSFHRQKWLQVIIRIAMMKHLSANEYTGTYADAVRLVLADAESRVDGRALVSATAFREKYCYVQGVSDVLTDHIDSLRAVYKMYAKGDGAIGSATKSTKLLDFDEWKNFCRDFRVTDNDFTMREVQLTFVWSRMRTKDIAQKAKITQLCFEDFLEAVVRIACTKTLPTDEQLIESGFEDAGMFYLTMESDPKLSETYAAFVADFAHRWDEELPQPAERAVEHVIVRWLRLVDSTCGKTHGRGAIKDIGLSEEKVAKFKKMNGVSS